jgi:phosphoadenosine phosphosulfate reductase
MGSLALDIPATWQAEELDDLNLQFRSQPPEALLTWAAEHFGQSLVLTCSFGGASGMVLLDMVARLGHGTPIVFLDTDLLFPETYALLETVNQRYNLAIERHKPALTLAEQDRQEGAQLYLSDPNRCCAIRKVRPLEQVLEPYDAWITGIRRDQASTRAATELLQWSARYNLVKIAPLAFWSERDVWRYIAANDVPYNELLDRGYPSIGCTPCTRPTGGDDPRAGRWAGFAKVECGIHS